MLLTPILQPKEFDGKLYVEFEYASKHLAKFMAEVERLQAELDKTYNQLMEVEKDAQKHIAELESELESKVNFETDRLVQLPFDAMETANMLINATYKRENCMTGKVYDKDIYDINDLEQIAEHLLVYCKHNRDGQD